MIWRLRRGDEFPPAASESAQTPWLRVNWGGDGDGVPHVLVEPGDDVEV